MSKLKLLLILMMLSIAGCKSTIVYLDTSCTWVKPISTTEKDREVMTRQTKEEIAAHNDLWDSKCSVK